MASHIFLHQHLALVLFRDSTNHTDLEQKFREIASQLRKQPHHEEVFFVIADVEHNDQMKLADLIGISKAQMPVVALIHPQTKGIDKYILSESDLNSSMTYDLLESFLLDHKKGALKRHLRVQEGGVYLNGSIYEVRGHQNLQEFI